MPRQISRTLVPADPTAYVPRTLERFSRSAGRQLPVLMVTGGCQVGEATLLRDLARVGDEAVFMRFLRAAAAGTGQQLNLSDLARDADVAPDTATHWISILPTSGIIWLLEAWHSNLVKRLVKSPKVFIADSGVACHLLGIETDVELEKSPFLGALFEGFIAAEIVMAQLGAGRRRALYYFRDHQGLEVDFVVPLGNGRVRLVEAKATRTPVPAMADPMLRLAAAWNKTGERKSEVDCILVHRPPRKALQSNALAPGAQAMAWQEFVDAATL